MMREQKNLEFYLGLNYPFTVHADPDGGFVAEIEDLPGCMTQAETPDELFAAIHDARCAWIKAAYETGQDIPLPAPGTQAQKVMKYLQKKNDGTISSKKAGWLILRPEEWQKMLREVGL